MKKILIALVVLVVLGGGVFFALAWRPSIAPITGPAALSFMAEDVEHGATIAAAGYCASCHGDNLAGGRGIASDFGTIYASNISPDLETGIGTWSIEAFDRAMRQGVRQDGAHLFPALPYTHFTKMSDADINALYAYIMSQQAVANEAPETKLDGIFGWRALQGGWKLLYFRGGEFTPDASKSEEINRGAYLVEGVTHCGACHSPRNSLGAEEGGASEYAGALIDNWYAPSLAATADSPVPWTADEAYSYLRTGGSPLHGSAGGSMSEVVHDGLSALPDSDIRAIAAYFADRNGAPASVEPAAIAALELSGDAELSDAQARGEQLYIGYCVSCHFSGSAGPTADRPELALNSAVTGPDPSNFIRTVLRGMTEAEGDPDVYMPGFRYILSDRDVSDIGAYLRAELGATGGAWGNLEERVTEIRALNDPMR